MSVTCLIGIEAVEANRRAPKSPLTKRRRAPIKSIPSRVSKGALAPNNLDKPIERREKRGIAVPLVPELNGADTFPHIPSSSLISTAAPLKCEVFLGNYVLKRLDEILAPGKESLVPFSRVPNLALALSPPCLSPFNWFSYQFSVFSF